MGASLEGFMSHKVKMTDFASCILPLSFIYILIIYKIDLKYSRNLWIAYIILSILQLFIFLRWGFSNFMISKYYDITVAFIFARTLGLKKFFYYFENAVTVLTFCGFVLWILVLGFPFLRDLFRSISLSPYTTNIDFTLGFFGMPNKSDEMYRNCGFAWEPGRFASILVLTLLINLFRNGFNFKNRNFLILFIGLISTFSTTGYVTLLICILGIFINYKGNGSATLMKYFLVIASIFFFISSPFMLSKIQETSNTDNWLDDATAARWSNKDVSFTPQRFEGLYLETLNIIDSPLIGYGEKNDLSYVRRDLFPTIDIHLSNGILQIFSAIGIPLGVFLYILLWKSSKIISEIYNVKGRYLFFLMICFINVSYSFFNEPLIMFICLYSVFISQRREKQCHKSQ